MIRFDRPDHAYAPVYEEMLSGREEDIRLVLEIGVWHGAGILTWGDHLPNAEFIGIDVVPDSGRLRPKDTRVFVADATYWPELYHIVNGREFDLIVDDGSHRLGDQLMTYVLLWPFVALGGWYVIEDFNDAGMIPHFRNLGFEAHDLRCPGGPCDDILLVRRKTVPSHEARPIEEYNDFMWEKRNR